MKWCVFLSSGSLIGLLSVAAAGCAARTLNCPVAADQKSSFMAPAEDFPLSVAGDAFWSSSERDALIRAAETWNVPARRQMSEDSFRDSFKTVSSLSTEESLQGCDLTEGSPSEFSVHRIQSASQWSALGFAENTPAVTLRCHRGDELAKQAVLVNPDLVHSDQMMSVFLHELGHALGLDRSCQMEGDSSSYRGCSQIRGDHPYALAVMFPTLKVVRPSARPVFSSFSSALEVKESLGSNDLTRIGCIFGR